MRDDDATPELDAAAPTSARVRSELDGDTEKSASPDDVIAAAIADAVADDASGAHAGGPAMLGVMPAADGTTPLPRAAESLPRAADVVRPGPSPTARPRSRDVTTVVVVGFWRRLGAALIDLAIITPAALAVIWLAGKLTGVHVPRGLDFWLDLVLASDPALMMAVGLTIAVAALYVLVFQILHARTLGMRVLRMRVIDVYGDPPSPARCLARTFGYIGAAGTLLLGFLWIGFDREKRGLHDVIAGTYVIRS